MMLRVSPGLSAAAAVLAAGILAGCGGGGSPSPVVSAPTALSPSSGAQLSFANQPITLTVSNSSGSSGSPTYTFEVATDSGFANKVQTKTAAQGTNNQTSVVLDPLSAGGTYYWHARVQVGSTVGAFGATQTFALLTFSTATPVSPASGGTYSAWPTLVVTDVTRQNNSDPLLYRFDISPNSTFSPITVSGSVPETPGQTSFTPPQTAVTSPSTFYWQVTVIDQTTNQTGPPSAPQNFILALSTAAQIAVQEGIALWNGEQPPGTPGQATLGDNWNIQTVVSFNGVPHQTPTVDELRVFDAIDHGLDPQSAINWMNGHGYSTNAVWYPGPQVIGFPFEYMALVNNRWDLVLRAGG